MADKITNASGDEDRFSFRRLFGFQKKDEKLSQAEDPDKVVSDFKRFAVDNYRPIATDETRQLNDVLAQIDDGQFRKVVVDNTKFTDDANIVLKMVTKEVARDGLSEVTFISQYADGSYFCQKYEKPGEGEIKELMVVNMDDMALIEKRPNERSHIFPNMKSEVSESSVS